MPNPRYPDAGARNILREVTQKPVGGHFDGTSVALRRAATEELLDAAVELFQSYGITAQRFPDTFQNRELAGAWGFSKGRFSGYLLLSPHEHNGHLHAWRWVHHCHSEASAFQCELTWDHAEGVWLGESLGERDLNQPGFPIRRLSALETLARSIVEELGQLVET